MMLFLTLSTIATCLFSLWLTKMIQRAYFSPLSAVPSAHVTVVFSRLWLLQVRYRKCENKARLDTHRRLGPVVRVGPEELSINCIENGIRTVYGTNFDKDEWYARAFRGEGCVSFSSLFRSPRGLTVKIENHICLLCFQASVTGNAREFWQAFTQHLILEPPRS